MLLCLGLYFLCPGPPQIFIPYLYNSCSTKCNVHGCHRSGNSQGKKTLQGQGKVREFHFESGKIYIFEKSQGKVKF